MAEIKTEEVIVSKDFLEFPEELNKRCTKEEFHKMMTSHNSDMPVETVNFREHPDVTME